MFFSRWLRKSARPTPTFRPAVRALEERAVPAGLGDFFGPDVQTGPATHLLVVVPETARANRSFDVIVEALDASNQLASGYTGTVSLSLSPADAGATLKPTSHPFTANDHGIYEFHVTLSQTSPETIIATDNSATPLTASAVVNATTQTATTLQVEAPEQAATGVATRVEVEVLDQAGQVMRNFTGAVQVTSSDTSATAAPNRHTAQASVPITYTFTKGDHGEHFFLVTFNDANVVSTGTPVTVTASLPPANSPTLSGTAGVTLYPKDTVTHLGLFALPVANSGKAFPVEVVALNASNQIVTGYNGTVTFDLGTADTNATISTTRGG
ncbi:MAG TPA: hypothetical protein VFW33_04605, partial [Gemmataceae bacterium]|nr:hypothetical protein [Gemmataceae bacterium]